MKKLFALILALLMLCGCGLSEEPVEPETEGGSEVSKSENEEPQTEEKINIVDEVSYLGENGKYGFHREGVPVTEAVFDKITHIGKIEDGEVYIDGTEEEAQNIFAGIISEGTRRTVDTRSWEGAEISERENILYYLYEKGSGSVINETPLTNFGFIGLEGYGNSLNKLLIIGTSAGDSYKYIREKDGWELYEMQSGGVYNAYSEVFYMTRYCWRNDTFYYGLERPDGTVIIEPIYGNLEILPYMFVLAYDGYSRVTVDDFICTYIMDFDGNIICDEYNYISYTYVGQRKFVMIAMENDPVSPDAHWYFIDEKGNRLSESFNYIDIIFEDDGTAKKAKVHPDEKDYNPDAAFEEIPIEEYIIEIE